MKANNLDWTVFIFCYNEEHTVGSVVDKAVEVCKQLSARSSEVLVVNDGSSDRSSWIIAEKCKEHPMVRAIHHPMNKGIGHALISGYSNAKGLRICGVPADGQFDLTELLPFGNMNPGEVISFVRRQKHYNRYRSLLTGFNNLMNRAFLGLTLEDVNWVKIYHATDLKKIRPSMKSSLVESEICAKLKVNGVSFVEVPSTYHQRVAGETKGGSLKTVGLAAVELIGLLVRVNVYRLRSATS